MNYTVSECVYVREKERARWREGEREGDGGRGSKCNHCISIYIMTYSRMYVVNGGGNHTVSACAVYMYIHVDTSTEGRYVYCIG